MIPRKIAKIRDRSNTDQPMFVTWNDDDPSSKKIAFNTLAKANTEYGAIATRQQSYGSDIFMNAGPQGSTISVRDGMSRGDWEYFRPEEAIPRNFRNILYACIMAYKRVSIIKKAVDVMGEFTCQGIRLVHPNPGIQKIYEEWAKKVNFYERSERFCNYLYRTGNVIIQRGTAILKENDLNNLRKGIATNDVLEQIESPPKIRKGELPWEYNFINPLALDILGGEDLAQFVGTPVYGLNVPRKVFNKIRSPKTQEEKYIVSQLPDYIVTAVRAGKKIIPLDPEKIMTFYYKKDDWQIWAEPVTYSIIDDLMLFNKMRLADLAALDGAISHIRIWKLGDLANKIIPTPAALARLAEILVNNTAVGAIDLIWGPELTLEETKTDVHQFLGSEKYSQCLSNIREGLGIPSASRGSSKGGGKGGMESYLSLKIMIESLKYGRKVLNSFWEPEIVWVQRALGLRQPATIQYDYMVLTDENAFLRLLIELADRDLISIESIQESFGFIPEIEQALIRKEHRKRSSGKMKAKAGPFHQPQVEDDLLKIFAQTGIITPSEAGVELGERTPGEKSMMDLKGQQAKQLAAMKPPPNGNPLLRTKPKGKSGQGRPKGKKDVLPRKKRSLKPTKAAAEFFATRAWAREIQGVIAEIVNPLYVESCGKKNVRSLTDDEAKKLEQFKFAILCNTEPFTQFDDNKLDEVVKQTLIIPDIVQQLLLATLAKFTEKFGRTPTIDEARLFQAEVYSLYRQNENISVVVEEEEELPAMT
jgi:hypothetical protein